MPSLLPSEGKRGGTEEVQSVLQISWAQELQPLVVTHIYNR
jgi:hypothetical protein